MTTFFDKWVRFTALVLLALAGGAAQAHTGHGASSFFDGLAHPFGLDHLLAIIAVGVWSVRALPAPRAWQGPATFLSVLLLSALLGAAGFMLPYLEHALAFSVVVFGLMLVFSRSRLPTGAGLGLVALAAALHGLAHGAEATGNGLWTYVAGFLLATAVLQWGGVSAGLGLQHLTSRRANWLTAGLGALFGSTGVYLLQQV